MLNSEDKWYIVSTLLKIIMSQKAEQEMEDFRKMFPITTLFHKEACVSILAFHITGA